MWQGIIRANNTAAFASYSLGVRTVPIFASQGLQQCRKSMALTLKKAKIRQLVFLSFMP
jgi:hypothetical protein